MNRLASPDSRALEAFAGLRRRREKKGLPVGRIAPTNRPAEKKGEKP